MIRLPLAAGIVIAGCLVAFLPSRSRAAGAPISVIKVDYPADGALFPPDIAAPTFLWHDSAGDAKVWRIEVNFGERAPRVRLKSTGEPAPIGEIDPNCEKAGAVTPKPGPDEVSQHSWKPDPDTWAAIKKHSVKHPATVVIAGYADEKAKEPVSRGQVAIQTSVDPVGAPVFFRDVPLISVPVGAKGVIMPLPTEAVPLIAWRLRYVNEETSRLMMQGLPTCANCHSFSRDGKTLGLDVDGPQNDKGLYGIVPVKQETSIRNEFVIRWAKFSEERATKRFGFMSQLSPDGQYVITCIENPGSHIAGMDSRFFNGFYKEYGFGQVFYPTRGVLAWYSKATGKLQVLPGADDQRYVQASAFWSPDGKFLVYSRALAKDPYYEGQKQAEYANDPAETQIQYDLYRIPFNDGKGGTPELVAGQNGMSNNFPKVSPDGRWIVFVQNKNGLLMRPDSQLYIVPSQGGTPRRLNSNTNRMNSWHSFSPNGKWLVFSSKGRSLYTQMVLTHIDENGNDSPAILIEHATAANRAVNIPEFANIPDGALTKMDAPATDFYRLVDRASNLTTKGKHAEAEVEWKKAIELDPEDPKAHFNLALSYDQQGRPDEAIREYRRSLEINPDNDSAYTNLGVTMAGTGRMDEAIDLFVKALAINSENAKAESNLASALMEKGRLDDAIDHCRRAIGIDAESAEALNTLGWALARKGLLDDSVAQLQKAVSLKPDSVEYQYNLGRVLAAKRSFPEAIPHFEQAVRLSNAEEPFSLDMLAAMYSEVGRFADAVQVAQRALQMALRTNNNGLAQDLRNKIARYQAASGRP